MWKWYEKELLHMSFSIRNKLFLASKPNSKEMIKSNVILFHLSNFSCSLGEWDKVVLFDKQLMSETLHDRLNCILFSFLKQWNSTQLSVLLFLRLQIQRILNNRIWTLHCTLSGHYSLIITSHNNMSWSYDSASSWRQQK